MTIPINNAAPARSPIDFALTLPKFFPSGTVRCVLIGDSITNQCYQEFSTGQFRIAATGYFATASIATYGQLRLVADLGVSGETSEQIKARLPSALNTYNADVYILMAGTNDITNANISADTTIQNLKEMALAITKNGSICCLWTIPPKDTAVDSSSNTYATKHAYINWAIQYNLGGIPGGIVVDSYSTTVDASTGVWASSMESDGTHPLHYASIRQGLELADAISSFIPSNYRPVTMPQHQFDGWNLVYNPYMTGSNAAGSRGWTVNTGVTGTGPDGYNAARYVGSPTATVAKTTENLTNMARGWTTLSCSFAADSDCLVIRSDVNQTSTYSAGSKTLGTYVRPTVANGYAYRCITAGTASAEPTWPTTLGQTVTDGTVTWQCVPLIEEGARYVACAEYRLSSVSGNVSPVLIASCRNSGGSVVADMAGNGRATADVIPNIYVAQGVIWTPEFLCPAGVNRIQVNCGIYGSLGGSCDFGVTGMALYKIPEGYEIQKLLTDS